MYTQDLEYLKYPKKITDKYDIKFNDSFVSIYAKYDNSFVAKFGLTQMPGCCGIVVSHNSYINHLCRNQGIGTLLHELRIDLAKQMGYSMMLCTDVDDNVGQERILHNFKWTKLFSFLNKRTNHKLNMYIKEI